MKYHNYDVDAAFLRSSSTGTIITWKITGSGTYFVGTKDGQRYMVKRYTSIRYPDTSLPKPTYDLYLEEFKAIRSKQNAIKKAFEGYNWKKDHIVIEADNFNDEENYYVVVTPWISNTVPSDYSFKSLSWDKYLALAREMCQELKKIHAVNVIHSDLKIENFCFAQEAGKLTPYLIDFDLSFLVGKAPAFDVVGGSIGYQAPELLEYQYSEDDSLGNSLLTPAIDVFSLAITLHCLYADHFPECGDHETPGDALNEGGTLTLDPIFDRPIGPNKNVSFKALLEAMLTKDFRRRPSMEQVCQIINDEVGLDGSTCSSVDFEDPWPEDEIEYLPPEELPAGHKFRTVKRAPNRHYKIIKTNGIPSFGDASTLIRLGLARKKGEASPASAPASTPTPAPEAPKPHLELDDGPWPEDAAGGFHYNEENIRAKGILSIKKEDDGGVHKYRIVYADHTLLMPGGMVKITRLITK